MKEYKIVNQKFSWIKGQQKFEDELNNYTKQGWRVISVYATANSYANAVLEKDKNR